MNVWPCVSWESLDEFDTMQSCPRKRRPRFCRSFSPIQMKGLLRQLLDVLGYVHDKKYVHRDIKCSNLLIDNNLRLKVPFVIICLVFFFNHNETAEWRPNWYKQAPGAHDSQPHIFEFLTSMVLFLFSLELWTCITVDSFCFCLNVFWSAFSVLSVSRGCST